ncbi:type I-E CRISPR-associated protein Cas5/CasD [Janthinobacterium sp. B9-8]|uniref:type I-E CRISPR-associated protein Cas5/CasD n=1 Tax=Janthinobacterium sp. B9-8 TaxID=1236179 RepID=UPI00061D0D24|nr:type I-E CRISPR-associated protein Cas5/CasD [Janthinobacterium sp. B9-8]AMC33242.1 type I-E CRISPR-associated protein Cas5/CasD [Janthinobacterium sp. B9-8]
MSQYLVFRLYGAMASFGEIAVGELRHSAVYPSRSALLGLLAAALGIPRSDEAGQQALINGYRFGVKLIASGTPLRDYHTVQSPAISKKITYRTRKQEMADKDKLSTILTSREYRTDGLYMVAVDALNDAPFSLQQLAGALDKPIFQLYLGRKSCPLALPLAAIVAEFESLKMALDSRDQQALLPEMLAVSRALRLDRSPRYFWEQGMDSGMDATLTQTRSDQPLSRARWQFAPRQELVFMSGVGS